jgi:hypothetical protein
MTDFLKFTCWQVLLWAATTTQTTETVELNPITKEKCLTYIDLISLSPYKCFLALGNKGATRISCVTEIVSIN